MTRDASNRKTSLFFYLKVGFCTFFRFVMFKVNSGHPKGESLQHEKEWKLG